MMVTGLSTAPGAALPPSPAPNLRDGVISTYCLDLDQADLRRWAADTTEHLAAMGCLHEPGRYAPTPISMPRSSYLAMSADVLELLHLARRVARQTGHILSWAREDQRSLVKAALDMPLLPPMARPDGIMVNGRLKLLELNLDSGLGGHFEVELLQQRLALLNRTHLGGSLEVPTVWQGLQAYIESLAALLGKDEVHLALAVDAHLTAYNRSHADIFVSHIRKHMPHVQARIVASDALRLHGDRMSDGRTHFDILWRFGSLAHPVHQVQAAISALRQALRSETLVVSSPSDLGVDGKLVLGCLSQLAAEGSPLLSPKEIDLVKRLVPWTRILAPGAVHADGDTQDLLALAWRNRERLILKRSHSKSSQQVHIGCETSDVQWRAQLDAALADPTPWVLQENLRSGCLRFQYLGTGGASSWVAEQRYSINPFIFGDALAAPFIRIERDERNRRLAIANVTAMAASGLVLESDSGTQRQGLERTPS
jgi:hypothetical protein